MRALLACALLITTAGAASADVTAFIGGTVKPGTRLARGVAVGSGHLFLGFEFEYAQTSEDVADGAPGLKTGMGNVLLQTPTAILGLQPYFTTGAGVYREELGAATETNIGVNTGGGVKISLVGPVRARIDYRVFTLRGSPVEGTVQRLYAGVNLKF